MFTLAFAQTASAGQTATQQNPLMSLMPLAIIFIIFYFLLIRPQKKTQQEHQKMIESLKKNDNVITTGGIHGTIVNLQDGVVTLRVDDNTRIKVQRTNVARLKQQQV